MCADYEGVAFVLVAEGGDIGGRAHFFYGNGAAVVEVAVDVSLENGDLSIIGGAEYNLLIFELLS